VTDLLRRHLAVYVSSLFDRHRIVVWEDDSGTLGPLLREAVEAGVTMPEFEGNLLSLRQAIDREDPWLERKWLLYVPPLPPNVDTEWLVDYEQAFWHLPQANLSWAFHEFFDLPDTLETRGLLRGQAAARVALAFDPSIAMSERWTSSRRRMSYRRS